MMAFACLPNRGSEPGMGWNRAHQAAKYCDVTVLTHEQFAGPVVREYLAAHGPIPHLQFEFLAAPSWEKRLFGVPGAKNLAYHLWHRRAYRVVQSLHAQHKFDLVHLVTYSSFREPGYVWKLDIPFVWGPLGGTQNFPWRFLGEASVVSAAGEAVRNVISNLQLRFSPRVRKAARSAAAVLVGTSSVKQDFAAAHRVTTHLLPDTGINQVPGTLRSMDVSHPELRLLWCGELETRKALPLLLKALARLPADIPFTLRVVGSGPQGKRWQRLARRLNVERHVEWLGLIPHHEALAQFQWADTFVFTSLRDTTGTVVMEAIGAGLPVICLDHHGAHDIVTPACGIRVPVTTPRNVVASLMDAICKLARDPQLRSRQGQAGVERARQYLWSQQGQKMQSIYESVLNIRRPTAAGDAEADLSRPSPYVQRVSA
jgi:glycosyltransferase involved in cell wall biosynthesis